MNIFCNILKNNSSVAGYRILYSALLLMGLSTSMLSAQEYMILRAKTQAEKTPGITVSDPRLMREENNVMAIDMNIEFPKLDVKSNGAVVISPMVVNGIDTLRLPAIGIYGRNVWYASKRNDRLPLSRGMEMVMRYEKKLPSLPYSQKVRYEDWMNGSDLVVELSDYGCAGCDKGHSWLDPLAHYQKVDYQPVFIYQTAVAQEVKTRELSGRAYIDFPVNRTEIYPEYRRNTIELHKILATIDSVRNDKDVSVTSISIKGFASPEGSYANNTRLAQGRTEALKNYVQGLYHFPPGFIKTDYDPEDWGGLREYVEKSNLPEKFELLRIIDDPYLDPDLRDNTLKNRFPSTYSFLLQNVYPALRHSDYRIEYEIRSFSDPVEIREMLVREPGKLSLNEIYIATQGLEAGSDEYNEIFETAARLFPNSEIANLNAANAMMQRGDLVGAEKHLARAGNSPEAIYARGVLAGLKGDFKSAVENVQKAINMGVEDNQGIMEHLLEAAKYSN